MLSPPHGTVKKIADFQTGITLSLLLDFYETGKRTEGLGLKKLRKNFWEIRSDIATRILFTVENDCVTFVIAGNHDEIRRHLKNV